MLFPSPGHLELFQAQATNANLTFSNALARADGGLDLVSTAQGNTTLFVWKDPFDSSVAEPFLMSRPAATSPQFDDVDGDGNDDMILLQADSVDVLWGPLRSTQTEPETVVSLHELDPSDGSVQLADVDGDGVDEWILGAPLAGTRVVRSDRPADEVQPAVVLPTGGGVRMRSVAPLIGDLTGDGINDVLVGVPGLGVVRIHVGPLQAGGPKEHFDIFEVSAFSEGTLRDIVPTLLVDANNDGALDIVTSIRQKNGREELQRTGGAAIWFGPFLAPLEPLFEPRYLSNPDAAIYGGIEGDSWTIELAADVDGDGTTELVLQSQSRGPSLFSRCGERHRGGAIAAVQLDGTDEIIIGEAHILAYGKSESGRMGRPFLLGQPNESGADALAVALPFMGEEYDCAHYGNGGVFEVVKASTGGIGVLELD